MKEIIKKLKNDYNKRTVIFAFLSVLAIICFTVYNAILGFLFVIPKTSNPLIRSKNI